MARVGGAEQLSECYEKSVFLLPLAFKKTSGGGLWAFAAILIIVAEAYLFGIRKQSNQSNI